MRLGTTGKPRKNVVLMERGVVGTNDIHLGSYYKVLLWRYNGNMQNGYLICCLEHLDKWKTQFVSVRCRYCGR